MKNDSRRSRMSSPWTAASLTASSEVTPKAEAKPRPKAQLREKDCCPVKPHRSLRDYWSRGAEGKLLPPSATTPGKISLTPAALSYMTCHPSSRCRRQRAFDLASNGSFPAGGTGRTAVGIIRIALGTGGQDFGQPVLDVQLELGGDLRQVDPERTPHFTEGAVERPARPVAVMVGIQGHLPAIGPDPVQKLPADGNRAGGNTSGSAAKEKNLP